jgi:hypothetical protein
MSRIGRNGRRSSDESEKEPDEPSRSQIASASLVSYYERESGLAECTRPQAEKVE